MINSKIGMKSWGVLLALIALIGFGCSSSALNNPVSMENPEGAALSSGNHAFFGLYQFVCNPDAGTLDVIPLRAADMHLNALPFLEPPALMYLTLESAPEVNGTVLDVDIGLRHPFLGLNEFSGFDVCGLVISNGSYSGYGDSDIRIAGPTDLYLVNADGHARWWNPDEFPNNGTMFGYVDGLLGAPDSFADYDATLNGYKYFADGLDPDDDVTTMDPLRRGLFSAGSKNIRHYTIDMGEAGLIFNYAIDANWTFPDGDPPWVVPDDFTPEANRVEPYFIDVRETANNLWYYNDNGGGQLSMEIDIYDWYNIEQDWLRVECPSVFTAMDLTTPTGGGEEYSTFSVDIASPTLTSSDDLMILISAYCEEEGFQDFVPGSTTAAYKMHYADVDDEPSGPAPEAVADSIPLIGFVDFAGDFFGNDTTGTVTLYEWDFDGDGTYDWSSPTTGDTTHAYADEGTFNATLKASNGANFTTDSVEIRMIDPLPIIQNGNFWDATWDDWTLLQGGQGSISNTIEDINTFKRYVRFHRTNAGSDGGQSRLVQSLNVDVTGYDELYFNAFLKIITQQCPGDGWWGPYGGWGDFPAHIIIFYLNQNDEARFACYGWIIDDATTQYNYVWEWDQPSFLLHHPECAYYEYESYVTINEWLERKTIDLMTLGDDAPKELTEIWVWTHGWDYEVDWILPWFSDH